MAGEALLPHCAGLHLEVAAQATDAVGAAALERRAELLDDGFDFHARGAVVTHALARDGPRQRRVRSQRTLRDELHLVGEFSALSLVACRNRFRWSCTGAPAQRGSPTLHGHVHAFRAASHLPQLPTAPRLITHHHTRTHEVEHLTSPSTYKRADLASRRDATPPCLPPASHPLHAHSFDISHSDAHPTAPTRWCGRGSPHKRLHETHRTCERGEWECRESRSLPVWEVPHRILFHGYERLCTHT